MATKKNTDSEDIGGKQKPTSSGQVEPKPRGERNRALPKRDGTGMPGAKYMDEFFEEFVVLAKPLAVWSKPNGHMSIVNSIEEVIAITLHTQMISNMTPLTFRDPNEVERFARVTLKGKHISVVLGTHLEHNVVMRRPKKRSKKASAPAEVQPLDGIDAATVIFHWLNRGKLPSWAVLTTIDPAASTSTES